KRSAQNYVKGGKTVKDRALFKLLLVLGLVALLSVPFAGCAPEAAPETQAEPEEEEPEKEATAPAADAAEPAMDPVTWIMPANLNRGNASDHMFVDHHLFSRIVYEETGGLITIETRDGLYDPKETLYAVADGRAEVGHVTLNNHIGDQPLWGAFLLPFLYRNSFQMAASFLYSDELQDLFQQSYEDIGVHAIGMHGSPPQEVWVVDGSIETVAEFEGKKIRCSSMLQQLAVDPLGGSPLTIPFGELFTSMERGILDAAITSCAAGVSIGLHELCDSVVSWPITPTQPYIIPINKDVWDGLPMEMQDALERAGKSACLAGSYGFTLRWMDSHRVATAGGVNVVAPSESEVAIASKLMEQTYESWYEETGDEGRRWVEMIQAWIEADAEYGWQYGA
ncbi:TRAP transporter substrate-binding protein, partial [Chloroflexota bacterium]